MDAIKLNADNITKILLYIKIFLTQITSSYLAYIFATETH